MSHVLSRPARAGQPRRHRLDCGGAAIQQLDGTTAVLSFAPSNTVRVPPILPLSRVDNDAAPINHALKQMERSMNVIGALRMFRKEGRVDDPGGIAQASSNPARGVVKSVAGSATAPMLGYATARYFQPLAA